MDGVMRIHIAWLRGIALYRPVMAASHSPHDSSALTLLSGDIAITGGAGIDSIDIARSGARGDRSSIPAWNDTDSAFMGVPPLANPAGGA